VLWHRNSERYINQYETQCHGFSKVYIVICNVAEILETSVMEQAYQKIKLPRIYIFIYICTMLKSDCVNSSISSKTVTLKSKVYDCSQVESTLGRQDSAESAHDQLNLGHTRMSEPLRGSAQKFFGT
jgi:hypothetical protein